MNRFYRSIKFIISGIVRVVFRLKFYGIENIPKSGGAILCCNHTTMWDVVFLIALCPREISFMAKQELFKNKILGYIFRKMLAFPVNREKGDSSAIRNSEAVINMGGILGIFPEGTRRAAGKPGRGKPGAAFIAAQTKADIIPVAIYREGRVRLFQRATVRFGKVIPNSELEVSKEDVSRSVLSATTNRIMQEITTLWEMKY